jgi:hypothetical protein
MGSGAVAETRTAGYFRQNIAVRTLRGVSCGIERYDWQLGATGHPIGVPMTVRLASCCCGQLRAEVLGEPISVSVCHCYACQRRTGSVFGAQAYFARESVVIKGHGTQFVRVGDEGGRFTFTFCPKCGSTVFYVEEGDEQHIAIPVGPLRTHAFRPRRSRSTRSAGIPGSPFPTMSACTSVTRRGPDPLH